MISVKLKVNLSIIKAPILLTVSLALLFLSTFQHDTDVTKWSEVNINDASKKHYHSNSREIPTGCNFNNFIWVYYGKN